MTQPSSPDDPHGWNQQPSPGSPPQQYPQQQPQQQYPQQQGDPAPGWGYPQPNPFDSESTSILVTGILSLVLCGFIGIYAWIQGNKLRDRANAAGWPEPSNAKVGRILGIVGTCIGIGGILLMIVYFVILIAVVSSTA